MERELKGTVEHQFFNEYWHFRKQFYEVGPDDGEHFFEEMTRAASELGKKYENTEIAEYTRKLIVDHMDDVELRAKRKELR